MSGAPTPEQFAALLQNLDDLKLTRLMQVAATSLIGYDYVILLGAEVKYFWYHTHPRSIPRMLFFLNRYFALFALTLNTVALVSTNISDKVIVSFPPHTYLSWRLQYFFSCDYWLRKIIGPTGIVEIFLVQLILLVRIDGMYGQVNRKYVTYPLLALWAGCLIASTVVADHFLSHAKGTAHPLPGLVACVPVTPPSSDIWTFWVPILVFEATAFSLAVGKTVAHLRSTTLLKGSFGAVLMKTILRDSIVYFGVILCLYIINATLWRYARPALLEVAHGFVLALISSLASRMLINLREKTRRTTQTTSSENTIQLNTWSAKTGSAPMTTLGGTTLGTSSANHDLRYGHTRQWSKPDNQWPKPPAQYNHAKKEDLTPLPRSAGHSSKLSISSAESATTPYTNSRSNSHEDRRRQHPYAAAANNGSGYYQV